MNRPGDRDNVDLRLCRARWMKTAPPLPSPTPRRLMGGEHHWKKPARRQDAAGLRLALLVYHHMAKSEPRRVRAGRRASAREAKTERLEIRRQ